MPYPGQFAAVALWLPSDPHLVELLPLTLFLLHPVTSRSATNYNLLLGLNQLSPYPWTAGKTRLRRTLIKLGATAQDSLSNEPSGARMVQ